MMIISLLIPWEPSLFMGCTIALAAFCYARGSTRESVLKKGLFWCGLALIYTMLLTQYDYYAEHAFFMHRLQHLALHHLAPFLIAASAPFPALGRGLSAQTRRMLQPLSRGVDLAVRLLSEPLTAVLLFDGLIALWLIPSVHLIAMIDWRIYRLMNWGMLINGLLFWHVAIDPASRASLGARIAMMLGICPAQIVMGVLLCFSDHDFYPIYTICGRIFPLSPLADQQIGGILLWVPGAMMSVTGVLVVIFRSLNSGSLLSAPQ